MEPSVLKGRCSSWGCRADWWASSICSRAGIPAPGSTALFHSSILALRRALGRWRATTIPCPCRGKAHVRILSGMANIPVGTVGEEKLLVTSEVTINFLGMEGARVLSTPHMIGYMERTSRNTWDEKEKIGEGTHERAIIDIAKFATRLAEKLK